MINNLNINLSYTDLDKLQHTINTIVSREHVYIDKPCYKLSMTKYANLIFNNTNYSDDLYNNFIHQLSANFRKFEILNDRLTVLLIILILYLNSNKKQSINDKNFIKSIVRLLAFKFYGSSIFKQLKFTCSSFFWQEALKRLNQSHLFQATGSISNGLIYIADTTFDRYSKYIKLPCDDAILMKFISELRSRINQSTKSFMDRYYDLIKQGKQKIEDEHTAQEQTELIISKISTSICTFGEIDEKAIDKGIVRTNISKDLAENLISELSDSEYKQKIEFILILISRLTKFKNLCNNRYIEGLIRQINSNTTILNYKVADEILKLLYTTTQYTELKKLDKPTIITFFVTYLSHYIKNRIC